MTSRTVLVIGAGVAGLCAALVLARRGHDVTVLEARAQAGAGCTHHGGGMLSPIAELLGGDAAIARLGLDAVARWRALVGDAHVGRGGSLIVAHRPEWGLLDEVVDRARRADLHAGIEVLDADAIAVREPWLSGRITRALSMPDDGVVHPRLIVPALLALLQTAGVVVHTGVAAHVVGSDRVSCDLGELRADVVVDARGLDARDVLPLRGVRGEYALLRTPRGPSRHVRLLHPRYPIYVIPRPDHRLYVGATSVESEHEGGVHVRSVLELLSGLWSLDPSLADAEVEELGVGLRPALPDNLPVVAVDDGIVRINGLYRHGFLLSPVLADDVALAVEAA